MITVITLLLILCCSCNSELLTRTYRDLDSVITVQRDITSPDGNNSKCWELKADIVFVMDSSGSIGSQNFYLQKNFLVKFAEVFDIGPNDVQVSVVSFSGNVQPEFNLNTFNTSAALVKAIKNIRYIGGGTETDAAIHYVTTHTFTAANGARPNVHKLMILLTDGQSNNHQRTVYESRQLHLTDIKSIAVGVGSGINRGELNDIASDPSLVLTVNNYQSLQNLQKDLISLTTGASFKTGMVLHSPECVFHHNPSYSFCDCQYGMSGHDCNVNVTTCMENFKKFSNLFIRCGYDKDDNEERCFIQCRSGYQPAIPIDGTYQCKSCKTQKLLAHTGAICVPGPNDVLG